MAKSLLDFSHLTIAERIQLAEDLWDSISEAPEILDLTVAQRAELDRRLEAHRKNPAAAILWEALRQELHRASRASPLIDYRERIVIDTEVRFGKPIVRGTRITVGEVLSYLAGGMIEEEILADFPQLRTEDIRACLAFAAERERRLASVPTV